MQVWLSSGRYAVIDLSADPCTYGKIETEEGSVSYKTIPRLLNILFPRGRDHVSPGSTVELFTGYLRALISTTVEHVLTPDVRAFTNTKWQSIKTGQKCQAFNVEGQLFVESRMHIQMF